MPELRRVELQRIISTHVTANNVLLELFDKFSNLNKICRIVAYCLRFSRLRVRASNDRDIAVSHGEFSAALNVLCKLVQRTIFSNEIRLLESGVSLGSSLLTTLSPFMDNQGLLRVGERLKNSQLSYNAC